MSDTVPFWSREHKPSRASTQFRKRRAKSPLRSMEGRSMGGGGVSSFRTRALRMSGGPLLWVITMDPANRPSKQRNRLPDVLNVLSLMKAFAGLSGVRLAGSISRLTWLDMESVSDDSSTPVLEMCSSDTFLISGCVVTKELPSGGTTMSGSSLDTKADSAIGIPLVSFVGSSIHRLINGGSSIGGPVPPGSFAAWIDFGAPLLSWISSSDGYPLGECSS
mmetsp:Transcript_2851/g.6713  ORF Transcript_2851/g.6713 Transcript_2851/m.6713 type:complete len:220 (+) Transcript_2851:382-1041(+)